MYQNTKKLMDTSGSKRPELIPCLDGIRFLSMTWVVILHTYDYSTRTSLFTVMNKNDIYEVSLLTVYIVVVVKISLALFLVDRLLFDESCIQSCFVC